MTTTERVDQVTLSETEGAGLGWVRYAQCGGTRTAFPPETWFSDNPVDIAIAIGECERCPVRRFCATSAMAMNPYAYGVWGGEYHPERRDPVTRGTCGTDDGVRAHRRGNELLCDDCRAVVNARERARKRRQSCAAPGCDEPRKEHGRYCSTECRHVATVGTLAGARLHQTLDEPCCAACAAVAHRPGSRTTAAACLVVAA
jgi:hypothetical protein